MSDDFEKRMAEIDKLMSSGGGSAPPAPVARASAPEARGVAPPASGGKAFTAWLRVGLVVLLAAAMPFWPFGRRCGVELALYIGALSALVLGGVWSASSTFQRRLPRAHVISLLVILSAIALLAREILPRVGYARVTATWVCP